MSQTMKLFRIFGIQIQIHYSWWFIFGLLTWSLSSAFFPHFFSGYDAKTYWFMGAVSSLLLFVSVLLHELSHSLAARLRKIKVESITLFFFGGVAGITKENIKPMSEFLMAISGPLFSLVLSGIFYLIYLSDFNGVSTAITFYLAQINLILALFNLVPGFPLDGGRAFRAILYAYYKDLRKATRIASTGGKIFGGFLIILGLVSLFSGAGNGLWFVLIGGFLYFIAGVSYNQVVIKQVLEKVSVKDLMAKNFPLVDPEMKLSDFIKQYQNSGQEVFLVKDDKFMGVLDLRNLPSAISYKLKLKQVVSKFGVKDCLHLQDNAYTAFKELLEKKVDLLPVMKDKEFVGVISHHVVMNRLMWELRFNEDGVKKLSRKLYNKR